MKYSLEIGIRNSETLCVWNYQSNDIEAEIAKWGNLSVAGKALKLTNENGVFYVIPISEIVFVKARPEEEHEELPFTATEEEKLTCGDCCWKCSCVKRFEKTPYNCPDFEERE